MKRPSTVSHHLARPNPSHGASYMAKANRTLSPFIYIAIALAVAVALVGMMIVLMRTL
jgi:hypothetical protein